MLKLALAAGILFACASLAPASAAPLAPLPQDLIQNQDLQLVEGGCGGRFYRGPYGRCLPKPYYIGPPYGPPVYYWAHPGAPRCVTRATPYGYKKVCRY